MCTKSWWIMELNQMWVFGLIPYIKQPSIYKNLMRSNIISRSGLPEPFLYFGDILGILIIFPLLNLLG